MSIESIHKVRRATDASLYEAKIALEKSDGDVEAAIELLNSRKVLPETEEKPNPVYPKEKPFWKFWK